MEAVRMQADDDAVIADALAWCERMLRARDEMNAAVHCGEVRWSPITIRTMQASALAQGRLPATG